MIKASQQEYIDSVFGIRNVDDTTKLGRFSAGLIGTGVTRTYALPDADGTIALEGWVTDNFLALAGGTMAGDINMGDNSISEVGSILFDLTPTQTPTEGLMYWNADDGTLNLGMPGGNVNLQIGQEMLIRSRNASGSNMTNGQLVFISGASGNKPLLTLAKADTDTTANKTIGMLTENINNGSNGYITTFGYVRGIKTDEDADLAALAEGDELFLSENVAGGFTKTKPVSPDMNVCIGYVIRAHATEGVIFIRVQRGNVVESPVTFANGIIGWDSTLVGTTTWGSGSDFTWTFNTAGANDTTIAFTSAGVTISLIDNAMAFTIKQGSDVYFAIDTTTGVEEILYGDSNINPAHTFQGLGAITVDNLTIDHNVGVDAILTMVDEDLSSTLTYTGLVDEFTFGSGVNITGKVIVTDVTGTSSKALYMAADNQLTTAVPTGDGTFGLWTRTAGVLTTADAGGNDDVSLGGTLGVANDITVTTGSVIIDSDTEGLIVGTEKTILMHAGTYSSTVDNFVFETSKASMGVLLQSTATNLRFVADSGTQGRGFFQSGVTGGSNSGRLYFSGFNGNVARAVNFFGTNMRFSGTGSLLTLTTERVAIGDGNLWMERDNDKILFGVGKTDLAISSDGTNGIIDVDAALRIGDDGTINYTQFSETGSITQAGTAITTLDQLYLNEITTPSPIADTA